MPPQGNCNLSSLNDFALCIMCLIETWANNLLLPTGGVSRVLVENGPASTLHAALACRMTFSAVRCHLALQEFAVH